MAMLGQAVQRLEDPRLLTEGGRYVADLDLPGACALHFVRSSVAHARILGIDTAEAAAAPGVVAVATAADLRIAPRPGAGEHRREMARPFLAQDVTRFVGEPVVAIVAEHAAAAADAAELVIIDFDPLPVLSDPVAARRDETLLFPEAGTNVAASEIHEHDERLFADCEVVVSATLFNQRLAPCPLEGRASAARLEPDGRLTYFSSTQAPHGVRDDLVKYLGFSKDDVHVIAPDVGGGFGAKIGTYPEELLAAHFARQLGRAVRYTETRSESMLGLGHGRGQIQQVTIGGDRSGTIRAYRLEILQDAGAYPSIGAVLPGLTRLMASGTYDIAAVECDFVSVVTNTTPTVAYRGAGRPEATAAIERAVEMFANAVGLDPIEVREHNLVHADAFPYTTPTGAVYDSGDYRRALATLRDASGYAGLRAEQARRREEGARDQLGIGCSTYVEITNGFPEAEFGAVEIKPDGTAVVRTGTSPHGQGHVTAWSMLAADALGLDLASISVVHGDTDLVPRGVGTFGSRSLQAGGVAVRLAADRVVELARALAAELFEADVADVVHDRSEGRFFVAGAPALGCSWAELAAASLERSGAELAASVDYEAKSATFPFGAHLAVVELDTETGLVRLERFVAVDDAGTILNPLLAAGQIHGGLAQGISQALFEEFSYDAEGNPLTTNFADYAIPSAAELLSFRCISIATPTQHNLLGAKGIGESGTIGSTPAVHNAVVDALAPFGVTHLDLPATPERVVRAMNAAGFASDAQK